MSVFTLLLLLMSVRAKPTSAESFSFLYTPQAVSPFNLSSKGTDHFIEPASPNLGFAWMDEIRRDPRDPRDILKQIDQEYPGWEKDVAASTSIYLDLIKPGLDTLCKQKSVQTTDHEGSFHFTEGESIPLEALRPLYADYEKRMSSAAPGDELASALQKASAFDEERASCAIATHVAQEEATAEKILCKLPSSWLHFAHCKYLVALNETVTSPEVSYPRLQFTINGFTRYTYQELLKLERLPELLAELLASQNRWLSRARAGTIDRSLTETLETDLLAQGFARREILLAFLFATRNMPSLDVTYGIAPRTALVFELYFWKFRANRDEVAAKYLNHAFPNHVFDQDPGMYHYVSAALQACELRAAGYPASTAELSALLGQASDKIKKYVSGVKLQKELHDPKYLRRLAREQGFKVGIQTGIYGGLHGAEFCK